MGASVFLKSVDFTAFAVNVKTIALGKYLYQFGHAIWWGTMPMAMFTFLEHYDLSGKKIIPFCTNEGSGMGSSERDLKKICAGAEVASGLAVRGCKAAESGSKVSAWAEKMTNR